MVFSMLGNIAETVIRGLMVLAGYVTNSSTFPQPLNEEDEGKYLVRLQDGDEEARAVLIERNLRLVAHICKKFDNTGEDTDDLISIGTVGCYNLQQILISLSGGALSFHGLSLVG